MTSSIRSIKYLGYYDAESNEAENRSFVLAATDKMDYLVSVLNRLGTSVQIVSASQTLNRHGYAGKVLSLQNGNTLLLFRTLPWGGKARRVASVLWMRLNLLAWLLANTRRGENILVYHSLGYASLVVLAKRIRRFKLILEVEEMYSDVSGKERDKRREWRVFQQADAFVFSTQLLGQKLNPQGKPEAIVHGTYLVEADRGCSFGDDRIHVVYAGTLDPLKGGAAAAAAASEFLDERYHVHILGFGSDADKQALLDIVDMVGRKTSCRVTYDGLLAGSKYVQFLQSCDIGLSTQNSTADFNETSFPSKVLSYLANGLKVVSVRLRVLEESGVGGLIFYCDGDTPEAIAQAIRSVDLNDKQDGMRHLQELDAAFLQSLETILGK